MLVVMGGSLGSLPVVQSVLAGLTPQLPAALVLVVHRLNSADDLLTPLLQRCCAVPVAEVLDKEPLQPGRVYVAPPDYHVLIERDLLTLSIDEPVHYARPSIDVLFESAALTWGASTIAVVLTGAGRDGAAGAAAIESRGGTVLIEDPSTAFRADLPAATRELTQHARLLPAASIGTALNELLGAAERQSKGSANAQRSESKHPAGR
jgi:two-component system, chemotaxis family, protein-glutamate methylesterase/glutaminase